MNNIVIVGSSGFAEEIKWLITRINTDRIQWNFLGFIDIKKSIDVIGDDQFLIDYKDKLAVVIAVADCTLRKKLYEKYKLNDNLYFPNLIDPSVQFSKDLILGEGNIICANSILTVKVKIGNFNIVNLNCTIGHEATLLDFVTLNPAVNVSGNVTLQEGVFVGTGTQILQGKTVNKYTVVGAGAVVTTDVPELCTAVGVPAKVIKDRR